MILLWKISGQINETEKHEPFYMPYSEVFSDLCAGIENHILSAPCHCYREAYKRLTTEC